MEEWGGNICRARKRRSVCSLAVGQDLVRLTRA